MVDRKENLNALVTKAAEWDSSNENASLAAFLEELSLKSTLDEASQEEDRVNLMTIHNGKGLEFPVVCLAGMEEDLFPHINSREDSDAVEEERRLCYVGMTRAKEHLYLTHALNRAIWGVMRTQKASRFLREIPQQYVEATQAGYRQPLSHKNPPAKGFSEGSLVFHQEFGIGRLQEIGSSSVGMTYKIFFSKDHQERTLVAEHCHLTLL